MQKQESSEWWKWLVGLVALVALLYFAHGGRQGADKEPTPKPTPRPTSSLPDNCWNTPDGIECREVERPIPDLTEYMYAEEIAEELRMATIEAAIDNRWDQIGREEAEAAQRQEEGMRKEATIEAELRGEPPPADVVQPEASKPSPSGQAATLLHVTDGDSIVVQIGGNSCRVRYIGINTPEFGQYGFDQATEVNRQLLASGPLRLQRDVSEADSYDRLLRYVYAGGVFVNAELVRLGYAQAATYPPDVKHSDYFVQLEREARESRRGLWAE